MDSMRFKGWLRTMIAGVVLCTGFFADGCGQAGWHHGAAAPGRGEITVTVDPRIELLSVVQYLSDYRTPDGKPILTRLEFPLKREVIEHFAAQREHPAVRHFAEMSKRGFSFGMPPEAMLSLSDPPELKVIGPFRDMVVQRAGGRENLEAFIGDLRRFARDTKFMDFYRSRRDIHAEMVREYRAKMREWGTAADIEEYFGWSQAGYHIVLAPFFHPGGFGPRIPRAEGLYDVYSLCGPYRLENGRPDFGSAEEIRYLIWHEFGHSFVNHLTDAHIGALMTPCASLMPVVSDADLQRAGVDRSDIVSEWVSEHIIRSVTVRLAFLKMGDAAGNKALREETGRGYPCVGPLCRSLETYESKRDVYPTLRDYFPELVRVLETEAGKAGKGK